MIELAILVAMGLSVGAVCYLADLYEECVKEFEAQNKERMVTHEDEDYVYMADGTPVKYDEDSQE